MVAIETRKEGPRGCGYRKGGGIYLVSDGMGRDCGRMPLPLEVCPTCHQGIKPSRGWTWIDGTRLLAAAPPCDTPAACEGCPLGTVNPDPMMEKVGLLWVGSKFYPTPEDFGREAARMGISRRIKTVPRGFEVGMWVWLAHRQVLEAIHEPDCATQQSALTVKCDCEAEMRPGVFHVFRPQRIEYVVKGDETDEELEALVKRGMTLVKVERVGENLTLVN